MSSHPRSVVSTLKNFGLETGLFARHLLVWLCEAFLLIGLARWIPGLRVTAFSDALIVTLTLATVNAFVMPTLFRFAVRLRAFLFPLISFFLNGSTLVLMDQFLPHWHVDGWFVSGIIAAILTGVATIIGSMLAINDESWWQRFALGPMRARYQRDDGEMIDTPGFVFLEIDGLAEPVLRDAIEGGYVPTIASWLKAGTHRLDQWECDLSSQTSGSQAGILLGNNADVPGFRWYDKELGRVIVSNHLADTALLQRRLSRGNGLLVDDGASRGNLFSGDAPDSLFTFSTIGDRASRGTTQYWFFYANFYNMARTMALFFADVVKEWIANLWQKVRNERPRVRRGGLYPLARASTTSLLRELSTFTVAGDMLRGVPAIYTTYLAYDEVAHHSGIARGDTFRVLKAVDRDIGRLANLAKDAGRPYHLIVLSDHGQSQGETFRQRYGQTLQQLVEQAIAQGIGTHAQDQVSGSISSDEGWQTLSALLTELLGTEGVTRPMLRRALGRRITDEGVDLPAMSREERKQMQEATRAAVGDVVVLGSGSLGLISFTNWSHQVTLEDLEDTYPMLVPTLVEHPGIGFVVMKTQEHGPIVLGKAGIYVLNDDRIAGENPLADYGPHAAQHIRRAQTFANAPDIYVNSRVDPETGEIPAFEELVGSHGGLGGTQTQPFLLHPVVLDPGPERIVGAEALYAVFKRWIAEQSGPARDHSPIRAIASHATGERER